MSNPRIILAAPKSGSGKTLITCALLRALVKRGLRPAAFKCGPDYIDPMFHRKVLGVPSKNLDLFFTGEEATKALFLKNNDSDISVIEGVMGLYDGLGGISEEASAYHLARTLKAPILLIINARGMGRSLLAEIAGFLSMDREHLIRGILLNQVSASFYESIAPLVEEQLKVPVLGYFPVQKDLHLDSRYLGLKLPDEIRDLQENVEKASEILEKTVDLDKILECSRQMAEENPLKAGTFSWLEKETAEEDSLESCVRIGVALDEAFCFYYQDNFTLLENAGAKLVFFSPLRDKSVPEDLDGLLLGGGYPELLADKLSENVSMRESIAEAIDSGMPVLAECGGFLYLHRQIEAEGRSYPMVGVIPGKCFDTGKLVRFGYAEFAERGTGLAVRGHEFHYFDSESCGEDWTAVKPVNGKNWKCMHEINGGLCGFGHLYYPSAPEFVKRFTQRCREYRIEKQGM